VSERAASVTAWSVWLVGMALAGLAIGFASAAVAAGVGDVVGALGFPAALLVNSLGFVTVGAFLGARLPRHPIGWLLAGWGTVMAASAAATTYDVLTVTTTGASDALDWVRWGWAVVWHPMFALLFFTLLLFPDGRLPSSGWRHVARVAVAWYALLALAIAFSTESMSFSEEGPQPPPAIPTTPIADAAVGVLLPGQVLLIVVALAALLRRWRRSTGRVRAQISWFVYAVTVSVAAFVLGLVAFGGGVLFPVFVAIPLAAGYAVLRRRLYDIGRVVRRTVSYALVAGVLTLAYVGAVLALQRLLPTDGSEVVVAASTLVAVALFQPVRRRTQTVVDRRFNRGRYDAAATSAALAQRLRDEVELTAVVGAVTASAASAVQPVSIAVWLPGQHEEADPW
jgi:MFS family permease